MLRIRTDSFRRWRGRDRTEHQASSVAFISVAVRRGAANPEGALAAGASRARARRVREVEELFGRGDGVAGTHAAGSAARGREEGEGPVEVLDAAWFHGFAAAVAASWNKGGVYGVR
jgi:hypothetical protein